MQGKILKKLWATRNSSPTTDPFENASTIIDNSLIKK
jgi:hypothetical protein